MPIQERRKHYNALARRMNRPQGLKPGLLEKYKACEGNSKQRFEMMKAFLIDPDMILVCSLRPFVSAFPWHVPHYLDLSQEGPWGWGKLRSVLPSASAFPLHVVTAWVCVEPGKPKPKRIKYMRNYLFLRSRTSGVSRMPARYSSNLTFWLLILMKTEAVVHFSCNFLYFFLYMCHILYHAS